MQAIILILGIVMSLYKQVYKTIEALDDLIMYSDGTYLIKLTFVQDDLDVPIVDLPIFDKTKRWLDIYFSGVNPDSDIEYKIDYKSSFQKEVFDILGDVKYGETISYGDIAKMIASKRGIKKMSAQAVGNTLGLNPLCIIVPCHRVIGSNGKLVGYSGGVNNKIALLRLEKYGKM